MSVEVYGMLASQPSRSVLSFCRLSGIPFNFHPTDLSKGEHLSEEYAKINPNQEVPAITHGDYSLWESAAIVTYLADAFDIDNHWYPKDIKKRGRINAYLHWHHSNTRHQSGELFFNILAPKMFGMPASTPERVQQALDNTKTFLSEIDRQIGNGYICGSELTVADIFLYQEIWMLIIYNIDRSEFLNITRWYQEIEQLPEIREDYEAVAAFKGYVDSKLEA